jgi:AICAR transformylase/IMP cyclohydrolase PurH
MNSKTSSTDRANPGVEKISLGGPACKRIVTKVLKDLCISTTAQVFKDILHYMPSQMFEIDVNKAIGVPPLRRPIILVEEAGEDGTTCA